VSRPGKQPPRLVLTVEIEGASARVRIAAESAEDEHAVIEWLRRRPRVIASLGDVESLLARLDTDRRAA
jgi:hypothetical protein